MATPNWMWKVYSRMCSVSSNSRLFCASSNKLAQKMPVKEGSDFHENFSALKCPLLFWVKSSKSIRGEFRETCIPDMFFILKKSLLRVFHFDKKFLPIDDDEPEKERLLFIAQDFPCSGKPSIDWVVLFIQSTNVVVEPRINLSQNIPRTNDCICFKNFKQLTTTFGSDVELELHFTFSHQKPHNFQF